MSKERQHSILSASTCERWWNCPGSVNACKDIPNVPNIYMAEGTAAHRLAELCLKSEEFDVTNQIGNLIVQDEFEIEITEEMTDAILEYVEYVRKVQAEAGGIPLRLEEKIELKEVDEVMFGTADCVIVVPFKTVHVFDYKHGQGKKVSAWKNKQLLEYALGVMLKEDCSSFVLHVCQPRIGNGFTTYAGSLAEMNQFEQDLREHAKAALAPGASLIPGDWCKATFCPYRTDCPALKSLARDLIGADFASATIPVTQLSMDHIIKVLKYEDTIKDWMSKVRDHAKELMLQGEKISGYKIVQSLGHAKWIDEDAIIAEFNDEFGDKLWEKKLVSPSKFEKLAGKKRLGKDFREEYTIRPQSGYKIVEEEEQGEPIKTIKAQEDFDA